MTPTAEQLAIIQAATETKDNLLVSALAGAAKTSTLVLIAEALPSTRILCLAFNKKIATEMQERLPSNCTAMTLNSLGHRTWGEAIGRRLRIDSKKGYEIMQAQIEALPPDEKNVAYKRMGELMKIVAFGKACGYIPTDTHERAKRLMDDEDFFDHLDEELTPLERDLVRGATLQSLKLALDGQCDYDDQILMPTLFHGAFPRYPLVLVDEAQDLSALNHAMLRKMCKASRVIAVGDTCQPAGTKVTVVDKLGDRWNAPKLRQVNIEDVQVGEKLLGYNGEGAFVFNRVVEGVSQNYFEGELTTVEVAGNTSVYTENHHCYASFEPFREHYALYLMRKGKHFRVGRCKMNYGCGAGPTRRAHVEGADSYWLLGVYATERECAIEEAVVQAQFGIPDITFNCPNTNVGFADQSYLDEAWAYISASVDLEERAHQCLNYYKKVMEYPIWRKGTTAKFSLLRPSIVHACNLISGCLMLPYRGRSKILAEQWTPANITRQRVEDLPVYSLTVSHNSLYVADNIVTHNCQAIYGFRGAHADSMTELQREFSMKELTLSISFRCPKAVVGASLWRAPNMKFPSWAKEGTVTAKTYWSADDLPESAAVLCRNNSPLFALAIKLLKNGRHAEIGGTDIVKSILTIMRKFGGSDLSQTASLERIAAWEEEQKAKTKSRAHGSITDRAECMRIFIRQADNLGGAIAYAQHMCQLHSPLKLMTGHKSKGLEFDHVYILNASLLSKEGQDPNLRYVMITRAKETLTYVELENFMDKELVQ